MYVDLSIYLSIYLYICTYTYIILTHGAPACHGRVLPPARSRAACGRIVHGWRRPAARRRAHAPALRVRRRLLLLLRHRGEAWRLLRCRWRRAASAGRRGARRRCPVGLLRLLGVLLVWRRRKAPASLRRRWLHCACGFLQSTQRTRKRGTACVTPRGGGRMQGQRTGQEAAAGHREHARTGTRHGQKEGSKRARTQACTPGEQGHTRANARSAKAQDSITLAPQMARRHRRSCTPRQSAAIRICELATPPSRSPLSPSPTPPLFSPSAPRASFLSPGRGVTWLNSFSFFEREGCFCAKYHGHLQAAPGAPPLAGARGIPDAHSGARAVVLLCFGSISCHPSAARVCVLMLASVRADAGECAC